MTKVAKSISANQPIGIFDSGIGGLTVANAIRKVLPNESLVYFGDTEHLPYGDKSPDAIKYYALGISKFLLEQNCKLIVIACNSASSHAFKVVKDFFGKNTEVVDVISPVVKHVASNNNFKKVGVIGTKATIQSGAYEKLIHTFNSGIKVSSLATPLLASMIEEGYFNNKVSLSIIESYLSNPKLKNVDALVLACTHYPLIKQQIKNYYHNKVHIFDSANIAAHHVKEELSRNGLLSKTKGKRYSFYVSDYTESFEKSARMFFKEKIKLEEAKIWS